MADLSNMAFTEQRDLITRAIELAETLYRAQRKSELPEGIDPDRIEAFIDTAAAITIRGRIRPESFNEAGTAELMQRMMAMYTELLPLLNTTKAEDKESGVYTRRTSLTPAEQRILRQYEQRQAAKRAPTAARSAPSPGSQQGGHIIACRDGAKVLSPYPPPTYSNDRQHVSDATVAQMRKQGLWVPTDWGKRP